MNTIKFKIILLLFPTLLCMGAKAQTFEYLYNKPTESSLPDVVELDSSYLFVGAELDFSSQYLPLAVEISKDGRLLWDTVDHTKLWYFSSALHENGQNFFLVQSNVMHVNPKKIIISEVDNRLDTAGPSYTIFDTNIYNIGKTRMVSDSQLVILGMEIKSNPPKAFALLYNVHSRTHQFFDVAGMSGPWDQATDAMLLGGKYYIFKSRTVTTPSPCITYTEIKRFNADFTHDTTVAICHSKTGGNSSHFYFNVTAMKISDSTFMMVARADENSNAIYAQQIGHLVWDTNFTELSAEMYGKVNVFTIQAPRSISRYQNSPYVYLGGTENYKVNPSGYDTVSGEFFLIKTDLQGDTLWTRYYSNNSYVLMHQVKATSDGGALIFGSSYDHRTSNGFENDVWIIKVDSNGNFSKTTGLEENGIISEQNYRLFPNPMSDQLHFRQMNEQHTYSLQIIDVSGREVMLHHINSSDYYMDVSALSSGVYVYLLTDEKGNYASGKLIKN